MSCWTAIVILLPSWVLFTQYSPSLQHLASPLAQNLTLGRSVCIGLGAKCSLQHLHFHLAWIWTSYESRLPWFSHLYILILSAPRISPSKFFSKLEMLTPNGLGPHILLPGITYFDSAFPRRDCRMHWDGQHLRLCQLDAPRTGCSEGEYSFLQSVRIRAVIFAFSSSCSPSILSHHFHPALLWKCDTIKQREENQGFCNLLVALPLQALLCALVPHYVQQRCWNLFH